MHAPLRRHASGAQKSKRPPGIRRLLPAEILAFGTYVGLLEDLQALFQRPVDLVVESAIQNPYFRQTVESTRTLVYAD